LAQRGQLDWSDPSTSTGQYDPIEYGGLLVNYAVFIGRPNILFLVYQCVCEGGVGKDRVTSRNPITNASLRVELPRVARELDQDELIDRWTLMGDELNLVASERGATKLGFALLLRFYTERGRFPRGRGEIPDNAVDYVARQVAVGCDRDRVLRMVGPHDRVPSRADSQGAGITVLLGLSSPTDAGLCVSCGWDGAVT